MADKKISALPDIVALAAGDKIPVADASDLTQSKSATLTELITFLQANLTLAAPSSTAGVGTSPTATQTDTVTHSLGRAPVKIRIYGMSSFVANAAALPPVHSIGIWCSSGNRSVFQPYDAATITAAEPAATSTTNAIRLDTGVGNFIVGVIQNVGATTFDIAWTETGTATAQQYMWEAE